MDISNRSEWGYAALDHLDSSEDSKKGFLYGSPDPFFLWTPSSRSLQLKVDGSPGAFVAEIDDSESGKTWATPVPDSPTPAHHGGTPTRSEMSTTIKKRRSFFLAAKNLSFRKLFRDSFARLPWVADDFSSTGGDDTDDSVFPERARGGVATQKKIEKPLEELFQVVKKDAPLNVHASTATGNTRKKNSRRSTISRRKGFNERTSRQEVDMDGSNHVRDVKTARKKIEVREARSTKGSKATNYSPTVRGVTKNRLSSPKASKNNPAKADDETNNLKIRKSIPSNRPQARRMGIGTQSNDNKSNKPTRCSNIKSIKPADLSCNTVASRSSYRPPSSRNKTHTSERMNRSLDRMNRSSQQMNRSTRTSRRERSDIPPKQPATCRNKILASFVAAPPEPEGHYQYLHSEKTQKHHNS